MFYYTGKIQHSTSRYEQLSDHTEQLYWCFCGHVVTIINYDNIGIF